MPTPDSPTFTDMELPNKRSKKFYVDVEKIYARPVSSRRKIGQTAAGRSLQVFYVPDENPESIFVITAYELRGKAKKAFRRRQRRKPK